MSGAASAKRLAVLGLTLGALGLADVALLDFVLFPRHLAAGSAGSAGAAAPGPAPATDSDSAPKAASASDPAPAPAPKAASDAPAAPADTPLPKGFKRKLLRRVQFASDSWQLDGTAWRRLRLVVKYYKERQGRFLVIGHADGKGLEGYNDVLAMRRAEEVIRALRRLGLDPDRISAPVSMGSNAPLVRGRGARVSPRNRRAEVYLVP
jgi:outer membrane protein OmpA-like peptidoglycan-associated protein